LALLLLLVVVVQACWVHPAPLLNLCCRPCLMVPPTWVLKEA
jgi:hypothetical protein